MCIRKQTEHNKKYYTQSSGKGGIREAIKKCLRLIRKELAGANKLFIGGKSNFLKIMSSGVS